MMCNLWRSDRQDAFGPELSIEELEHIISDPLFAAVEHVDLNGGEPSIRKDTAAIADLVIEKFPGLKQISMSSNGLLTEQLVLLVTDILRSARPAGIKLSVVLSIHGVGDMLEKVNGIKNAFGKVERTLERLQSFQSRQFRLSANCVLTDVNVLETDRLIRWSKENGLPVRFALGEVRERFENFDTASKTLVGPDKRSHLIKFLRGLAADRRLLNLSAFRYHVIAEMIEKGTPRNLSCHYRQGAAIIDSYGDLYYCPHSKSIGNCRTHAAREIFFGREGQSYRNLRLIPEKCPRCPPYSFNRQELKKDFFRYFKFLIQPIV
jgi:MoaA/NifB/PqqE/SkfB family radical SAM enzyme